jgi:hypothetical protein
MLLRFPALFGFAGFAAFMLVLTGCSGESSSSGGGGPSSPSTSEPTDPTPTGTTTGTTTPPPPPPPQDAGADAAKDAGPPPTDVAGSAECTAYCTKMKNQCNRTCVPKSDCAIPAGQCEASERAYLDCQTTKGTWYCGADGFSIVSSCKRDATLCK